MAKKSSVAKNEKRKQLSQNYYAYRKELRRKVANAQLSEDERFDAHMKLQKLPRNTSSCRVVNRCYITGRPRGYLRKFGLSRIAVRELALKGHLSGVTKASW